MHFSDQLTCHVETITVFAADGRETVETSVDKKIAKIAKIANDDFANQLTCPSKKMVASPADHRHTVETLETISRNGFSCSCCQYITGNKYDFQKHLLTLKHARRHDGNSATNLSQKNRKPEESFACHVCQATYRSRGGLWKHRKTCGAGEEQLLAMVSSAPAGPSTAAVTDRDLVLMLLRENSEMKNLMIEQQSRLMEQQGRMMEQQQSLVLEMTRSGGSCLTQNNTQNNNTNTISQKNSHNKTFNLNFFLNETCKNAMNMSEFVESINLELADLINVGELGYVEGISDIIIKNLKALDITDRPIHCTDKKRETFYVKDENKWVKESGENQKIKGAITRVANKNYNMLEEYKRSHPECHRSHSIYADQYNKIIVEATGGNLAIPHDEKAKRIIHRISKEVGIHEST